MASQAPGNENRQEGAQTAYQTWEAFRPLGNAPPPTAATLAYLAAREVAGCVETDREARLVAALEAAYERVENVRACILGLAAEEDDAEVLRGCLADVGEVVGA